MMLPSVKDCTHGNCMFHFPQFRRFKEEEFKEAFERVLSEEVDEYYHRAYENWPELNKEYKRIFAILDGTREKFIEACGELMTLQDSQKSYIRYHLYLDLQGDVAEFKPCCI